MLWVRWVVLSPSYRWEIWGWGNHLLAEFSLSLSQPLSLSLWNWAHIYRSWPLEAIFGAESCLPCHFLLAPPGNTWYHWMGPSAPITSQQIDAETMETATDLIFLGSKITADGDCSHGIKRRLLLGRKVMTNLDSILKSRDITVPTVPTSSQSYGFSSSHVCMWELDHKESFGLWSWRRFLRAA